MPLTGTYLRTLDEKGRLAIPKRLRDEFGDPQIDSLYIAPGTDRALVLYSPQGFEALARRLEAHAVQQNYMRFFYSSAERTEIDSQGRIRLSERLANHAGLKRDAYLLGVLDHAELWDKEIWDAFAGRLAPEFDRLAAEAMQSSRNA